MLNLKSVKFEKVVKCYVMPLPQLSNISRIIYFKAKRCFLSSSFLAKKIIKNMPKAHKKSTRKTC